MRDVDHNKILKSTLKAKLKSIGLTQKGQSRTWLDDNYWFTTIIEFQPSNYSKGTYLNIGVCFQWYEKDYLSFDIGHREVGYCEFINQQQFTEHLQNLIPLIQEKVNLYRDKLCELNKARNYIEGIKFSNPSTYGNYHKGVINGLYENWECSQNYFNQLLSVKPQYEWMSEVQVKTESLINKLRSSDFKHEINNRISKSRIMKKMKENPINYVW